MRRERERERESILSTGSVQLRIEFTSISTPSTGSPSMLQTITSNGMISFGFP
jgi:hypothetical protein